jgi:hypothetical protein
MSSPRLSLLAVAGSLLACSHASGPSPTTDVQILALRPRLALAQARFTLRSMGYQVINPDTEVSVWGTAAIAGHATVRCNESLSRRAVAPNPVLAIVTARDTVGGAVVQIKVVGWRAGENPPLTLSMGTRGPLGPCVSTGQLERELFSVLQELARRAALSNLRMQLPERADLRRSWLMTASSVFRGRRRWLRCVPGDIRRARSAADARSR